VEGCVNDPNVERPDSIQNSPAVAFDDYGNIRFFSQNGEWISQR